MEEILHKYYQDLNQGENVEFRFTDYTENVNEMTLNLIRHALGSLHLSYLQEVIFTYTKEIINNARKANLKRVFFKKNNVDINDTESYNDLIEQFNIPIVFKRL